MKDDMADERIHAVERRQDSLDKAVISLDSKLSEVIDTLQTLVRIEERQISTGDRISSLVQAGNDRELRLRTVELMVPSKLTERLAALETVMPGLVESRRWQVAGILGTLAMVGAALTKGIFK